MTITKALRELKAKELLTLSERVEGRIKIKPGPRRVRKVVGVDIALTRETPKVHICAAMMSMSKMEVIEEAIATDEVDEVLYNQLGVVVFVPLVLSVLKMLKRKFDVVMLREPSLKGGLSLASYVGVISGTPSVGISERATGLKGVAKWHGQRMAGAVKIRGQKTPLGVIAGHALTHKDAVSLVKACRTDSRMPEPVRQAGLKVRLWEREWSRINIGKR
jgi:deoxyinosine 3'endonuclease (endonuclease V)